MGKPKQEEKPSKMSSSSVRDPKGGLPKKKRGKTTTGTEFVDGQDKRYCPSKRLKSAHRKFEGKISLKAFAEGRSEGKDWLANKAASGR